MLGHLKSFVRNRAQPEASISESYLAEETLTFYSLYKEVEYIPSMSTHPHVPPLMAPTPHPHIPPPMAPTSHPHVPPLVDTTQQPHAGRESSRVWTVHVIGNFKFYSTYK